MRTTATTGYEPGKGDPVSHESPGNECGQNILIRGSRLEKMRDPLHAGWNRDLMDSHSTTPAGNLAELIDFSQMNTFFANFLEVTGFPVAIIDLNAKVLASSKWQRLCMEYHRVHPVSLERCLESDRSLHKEMQEGKEIAIYRCLNGLTDCAAPIVIDGVHVANLFIGQFLLQEPDADFFKQQQEQLGFEEADYFAALSEVPIVSEAKLPAILNLVTGLAHQIADLSLARVQTLQANTELRHITKNLSDTQFAMDRAGIGIHWVDVNSGRLLYVNEQAAAMLGYSREEMQQLNLWDIDPDFSESNCLEKFEPLMKQGVIRLESTNRSKDGVLIPVEVTGYFLAPARFITFVVDITRRKNAERALKRAHEELERERERLAGRVAERTAELKETNEELMRAAEAKDEFLANMSHELRTPLNSILGFSQLLSHSRHQPLTEKQKEKVDHIMRAGEHLLELINEILDLAKIEAGKLMLSIEPVEAEGLLKGCLDLAKTLAAKRGILIENRAGAPLPTLRVDNLRARQAILNLLSNAVKYNSEGGRIWLDAEPQGDRLRIAVTDSGPGIPTEWQPELFQPFNRLSAEASGNEGTGIGLYLTKRLVETMGGTIGFSSSPGEGSQFWINFPVVADEQANQAPDVTDQEAGMGRIGTGSHLMLYVEDNPSNLALMEDIIDEIPNLSMISAHTAEIGLVMAEEKQPTVIMLDINLPGMDGIEAVRRLKAAEATRDIPVLALSANAMPKTIEEGLKAGFDAYLTKPIDLSELISVLRNIL